MEEWRHKADDLQNELDAAQREARNQSMVHILQVKILTLGFKESHRLRTHQDSLTEQVEGLRRENKVLSQEVRDLQASFSNLYLLCG